MVVGQHAATLGAIATLTDIGIALGTFAVVSAIAAAAGAANFGTALGIGLIAFAVATTAVIVLRD